LKKITNIILYVFLLSVITPAFQGVFEDSIKTVTLFDIDENEKDADNSEEKELEKNELDFFDKIIFTEKVYITNSINDYRVNLFHFLSNHKSQFKEIFSPPPDIV
jgi:hypothetical protein